MEIKKPQIDIIALLNKYADLYLAELEYDLCKATRQQHDIGASLSTTQARESLEDWLLSHGIFWWKSGEVIAKCKQQQ